MLDIKLFRENPELILDSERKRFRDTENVEKVIEYDTLWREGERKLNSLRSEKNKLSKSFKKAKEEGNLEEVIARDYQSKVIDKIVDYIKEALVSQSITYYGNKERNGMVELIKNKIDDYLNEHSDEIVKEAGLALAEKLARTKKGKAILDSVAENGEAV